MARLYGKGRTATGTYPERGGGGSGPGGSTLTQVLDAGNVSGPNDIEMSLGQSLTDENPGDGVTVEAQPSPADPTLVFVQAGGAPGVRSAAALALVGGTGSGDITVQPSGGLGVGIDSGSFVVSTQTPGAGGSQGAVKLTGPGAFLGLEQRVTMPAGVADNSPGLWFDTNDTLFMRDFSGEDNPVAYAEFARISLSAPAPFTDSVLLQVPFNTIDITSDDFGSLAGTGVFSLLRAGLYLIQVTITLSVTATSGSLTLRNGDDTEVLGITTFGSAAGFTVVGNFLLTVAPSSEDAIQCVMLVTGVSGNINTATMLVTKIR